MNAAHLFPTLTRPLARGTWRAVPLAVGIVLAMFVVVVSIWAAVAWALRAGVAIAFPGGAAASASIGTYSETLGAAVMLGIAVFAPRKNGKRVNGVSKPNRFGITLWQRGPFLLMGLMTLLKAIDGFRGAAGH